MTNILELRPISSDNTLYISREMLLFSSLIKRVVNCTQRVSISSGYSEYCLTDTLLVEEYRFDPANEECILLYLSDNNVSIIFAIREIKVTEIDIGMENITYCLIVECPAAFKFQHFGFRHKCVKLQIVVSVNRFIDDTPRYSDIVVYDTILQSCGRFVNELTMGDVQTL
nr:4686_t:CDS:2 [Entrophospora candida]